LELHLPNKKVSFKMKLLNLVLKQNIAPWMKQQERLIGIETL
jgi:hypothetical protein